MCMLAEYIPCGAGQHISRVSKMPKGKPAEEPGGWTVQSLLSITGLPESQLTYQEMAAMIQGACTESFCTFTICHYVVRLFPFKMLGPSFMRLGV